MTPQGFVPSYSFFSRISLVALLLAASSLGAVPLALAEDATCAIPGTDSASSSPVVSLGTAKLTRADLPADVRSALYDIERESQEKVSGVLKEFAVRATLTREKDKAAPLAKLPALESLLVVPAPSEAKAKAFFEENKAKMPSGVSFEKVRPQIERFLRQEAAGKAFEAKLAQYEKAGAFEVLVKPPLSPVLTLDLGGFPSKGPANAKVTLVEISDYLCSHCRDAQAEVEALVESKAKSLRFVQVNFALRPEGLSGALARGAWCSHRQGDEAFWKFHHAAFTSEAGSGSDTEAVLRTGEAAGVSKTALSKCLDSKEARAAVDEASKRMGVLGVTGTPTFFVNGRKETLTTYKGAVEAALR